jgi:hypothetical protein
MTPNIYLSGMMNYRYQGYAPKYCIVLIGTKI